MATLEIDLEAGEDAQAVRRAVKDRVRELTSVEHVTVEISDGPTAEDAPERKRSAD